MLESFDTQSRRGVKETGILLVIQERLRGILRRQNKSRCLLTLLTQEAHEDDADLQLCGFCKRQQPVHHLQAMTTGRISHKIKDRCCLCTDLEPETAFKVMPEFLHMVNRCRGGSRRSRGKISRP